MDTMARGRYGPPEYITAVWDGLSDGIVATKHGNACGAKAISQCRVLFFSRLVLDVSNGL